ncbi:hypothetical protein SPICUR_04770 [Spiribacter curvatus]|uniref:TatD family hydrolase n=2 Tax=Spiribacter curvatus TaxID=1335757 RepID=U5T6T6_9GAMM|nr:hypothetical protein SPICUR_04770 [Spiribacter curvatus]
MHHDAKFQQTGCMQYNDLIDIGVNLTHARFNGDRDAVIERASAAGVAGMVLTGVNIAESESAIALANAWPNVMVATAGVHPHHADQWSNTAAKSLEALIEQPSTVAVGETGLDYNRDFSPRSDQRAAFVAQLEIAATTQSPVFLHQRDADADFLAILREHRAALPAVVLHCFTGDQALLEACLALDVHIGITGWVADERRGAELRRCVPRIPADRLMIETDAPFLLPRNLPDPPAKRRNEPAFLPHVLEAVAALHDESATRLAESTAATSRSFFRLTGKARSGG